MSLMSVRGFAVASATAFTTVGSVVNVASGSVAQTDDAHAAAAGSTLLTDIPAGRQAPGHTASLTPQANVPATQIKWGLNYKKGAYGSTATSVRSGRPATGTEPRPRATLKVEDTCRGREDKV